MKQTLKQTLGTLFLVTGLFAPQAFAQEFALSAGFKSHNADAEQTGFSVSGKSGFSFGGLGFMPLSELFGLRTGFLYTQRNLELKQDSNGDASDFKFTYLDIPVTAVFQFSDYAGVFFGPVLSMNLSKDVTATGAASKNASGVSSPLVPLSLGVTFKFAPQIGGELNYEFTGSKVADGLKGYNSIGANLVIYFE